MHVAAVFGRIFALAGFIGYMDIDMAEHGSMPEWFPVMWWLGLFFIGIVFIFIGAKDYFNKKSGSKKIIWLDLLFAFTFILNGLLPFENSVNLFIVFLFGIVILSVINYMFFVPTWGKNDN